MYQTVAKRCCCFAITLLLNLQLKPSHFNGGLGLIIIIMPVMLVFELGFEIGPLLLKVQSCQVCCAGFLPILVHKAKILQVSIKNFSISDLLCVCMILTKRTRMGLDTLLFTTLHTGCKRSNDMPWN